MKSFYKVLRLFAIFNLFVVSSMYAQSTTIKPKHTSTTPINTAVSDSSLKVTIQLDHADWLYKTGENIKIRIKVCKGSQPVSNAMLHYTIGPEHIKPTIEKDLILNNGSTEIISKGLDTPGFLRCVAEVKIGEKKYKNIATAGFNVHNIQPTIKLPADFQTFWHKGKVALDSIPMNPTQTYLPSLSNDSVDVYQISFDNIKGKMYGILCKPHKAGKYPAILEFPGAGVYPSNGDLETAAKGAITLYMGIHGIPLNMSPSIYKDLSTGALQTYPFFNIDNKEGYYYHRVILGCLRAVDFVYSLPQFDGRNIAVTGSSQGGFLSLATASLDSRIKHIACLCPAMSDLTGYLHGRVGGWPHLYKDSTNNPHKFETAQYYDAVNFARNVKARGFYSWGYNDETTAPTTTYSVYNVIDAPKELHIFKEIHHEVVPDQQHQRFNWLLESLKADKTISVQNNIKDLVLIYDGGTHRLPWTKDRLKPYVYREKNGRFEWLFDGYLFLEIFDKKRNIAYDPGFKKDAATKSDFQSLLQTYFNQDKSMGALESVLDSLASTGKIAPQKHKIVIGIPVPRKDFAGWGSVDKRDLDFRSQNDISLAVQWYIDEAMKMWKQRNYKWLDLAGFYWVSEDDRNYSEPIKQIGLYLNQIGKSFYWIPYFNAEGADRWKEDGFSSAYYQPNYFFSLATPYKRLNDACDFAQKHFLNMEMEFDGKVLSDTAFRSRFDDYVRVFTERHIWNLPVAYYEGGGAWAEMSKSKDAEIRKRFDLLGDIIAKRQNTNVEK